MARDRLLSSSRPSSRLRVFAVLLLCFITGCAVDQEKEVAVYREIVDLPPATQPVARAEGEPLSLRDALLLANAGNERLSIEGEEYLQALINRRRAVANFLPTLALAPTYLFRDRTGGGSESNSQDTSLDVPLSLNVNLFNGFRDVNQLKVEDLTIEQRRALLLDVQEALLADVVRVYYQVLRDEELTRVLENSLAVQEERVRDIRGRQEVGVARPLDVAQTEAQASTTRVSLINARNAVRNGRAALAFLTGAPVERATLVDRYVPPEALAAIEHLLEQAAVQRQDLQAAQSATLASRQAVEVAIGQYYPSVSLDFDAFLYRETVPDERQWSGLLSAHLPIFSAGRIEADVREAWSDFRQARLFESLLRRQVAQDTEIAYQNLLASRARLEELATQVSAAEQAFNQAEASYNVGLATNLERITALDQLLSARLQQASEQFDHKIYYLDLLRATGTLREEAEAREAQQRKT